MSSQAWISELPDTYSLIDLNEWILQSQVTSVFVLYVCIQIENKNQSNSHRAYNGALFRF